MIQIRRVAPLRAVALLAFCIAAPARAELIEDIDLRRKGNNAIAPIRSIASDAVLAPPTSATASASAPPASAPESQTAQDLLAAGQMAYDQGDFNAAIEQLNQVLALPSTGASRRAQELIGQARAKLGDAVRARAEFELFLSLYPQGDDSERVRAALAGLPATSPPATARNQPEAAPSPWSGSVSSFFFGGQARARSQDFLDSPISGLPQVLGENVISNTNQRQVQTTVDLNWRKRDVESDSRFSFRDAYSADLNNSSKSKNRFSALYWDQRSLATGTNFRVGRQSPTSGGVLARFDGLQVGYLYKPKWRINAVAGVPTEKLLDSKRHFYGAWLDAEALTPEVSASLYFNQQNIDGQVDRRAVGTELRYFSGGVSVSSQLDYDLAIRGLNIASIQGTWQLEDSTVYNFLYDYRAAAMLSLGNTLFFQPTNLTVPARRIQDLLALSTIQTLRDQAKGVTGYFKQALLGVTTPLRANWQIGADIRLSNADEVKPVPAISFAGSPSTGNTWSVGAQLIGTNLYSSRDTHVWSATLQTGPSNRLVVLGYNNLSNLGNGWQLEPSLRFDRQTDDAGLRKSRWTPGMRASYRLLEKMSLESELTYEKSNSNSRQRVDSGSQVFYFLGVRYDL